eukprot:725722-Prymnesium_polylepis.1
MAITSSWCTSPPPSRASQSATSSCTTPRRDASAIRTRPATSRSRTAIAASQRDSRKRPARRPTARRWTSSTRRTQALTRAPSRSIVCGGGCEGGPHMCVCGCDPEGSAGYITFPR